MKVFVMLLRRELWEHRMLWITPLAIAGVMILTTLAFGARVHFYDTPMYHFGVGGNFGVGSPEDPGNAAPGGGSADATARPVLAMAAFGIAVPFFIAAAILAVVYLLDCLYADRRDRSVLFWRSLPMNDRTVVLSKLTIGLLVIPMCAYLAAALTTVTILAILASLHGLGLAPSFPAIWSVLPWLRAQALMLYGMFAAILWYAPYAAYLLMISALARRSVYAFAFIPPLLLGIVERVLLGTQYIGHIVQRGFGEMLDLAFKVRGQIDQSLGWWVGPGPDGSGGHGGHGGAGHGSPLGLRPDLLLASPQLLVGLVVAVVFVWIAIWLRRRSDAL